MNAASLFVIEELEAIVGRQDPYFAKEIAFRD